jgi:hypothetical protein
LWASFNTQVWYLIRRYGDDDLASGMVSKHVGDRVRGLADVLQLEHLLRRPYLSWTMAFIAPPQTG